MNWRETYGYPIWYPLALTALLISVPVLVILAIATGEWRWLLGALPGCVIVASIK